MRMSCKVVILDSKKVKIGHKTMDDVFIRYAYNNSAYLISYTQVKYYEYSSYYYYEIKKCCVSMERNMRKSFT